MIIMPPLRTKNEIVLFFHSSNKNECFSKILNIGLVIKMVLILILKSSLILFTLKWTRHVKEIWWFY